jgi:DNA-damage-inducible protein D
MSDKFVSSPFDAIRRYDKIGDEYWSARDLQGLLGYAKWQKFQDAIERAKMACKNSGQDPELNFTQSGKPIITGKGRRQEAVDYHMTRYACYLVAMSGDSHILIGSTLKLMRMAIKWRARGCASKK